MLAEILEIDYEKDLSLVLYGAKKACLIIFESDIVEGEYVFDESRFPKLESFLTSNGLIFRPIEHVDTVNYESPSGEINELAKKRIDVYVSRTHEDLREALTASSNKEFGLAMDYPEDASDSYLTVIAGELRDGNYFQVQLARAIDRLESWMAYLTHIPANFDIVGGNVSKSSRMQAEMYQRLLREKEPDLAARIEELFFAQKLPTSWTINDDGSYKIFSSNDASKLVEPEYMLS